MVRCSFDVVHSFYSPSSSFIFHRYIAPIFSLHLFSPAFNDIKRILKPNMWKIIPFGGSVSSVSSSFRRFPFPPATRKHMTVNSGAHPPEPNRTERNASQKSLSTKAIKLTDSYWILLIIHEEQTYKKTNFRKVRSSNSFCVRLNGIRVLSMCCDFGHDEWPHNS